MFIRHSHDQFSCTDNRDIRNVTDVLFLLQEKGAELHCLDPSGISYGYWGCAAGKAKSNAKTELEKIKIQEMTCAELVKEAAKIIYMVHDEVKDKMFELELSWVGEFTNGVHQRVPDNVSTLLFPIFTNYTM